MSSFSSRCISLRVQSRMLQCIRLSQPAKFGPDSIILRRQTALPQSSSLNLVSNINLPLSRCYSSSTSARLPEISDYQDVKGLLDAGGLVIDVRDAKELQVDGLIGNALHIPLKEVKDALEMNPENFEKKYKVTMPEEEDPIIFACLAGIRSAKAEAVANSLGFNNTSNYLGGFVDWSQRNK